MTKIETFLKDNGISYYRVMKLLEKNMGSFHKTKLKIQGKSQIEYTELEELCKRLSAYAKVTIKPEFDVKSVIIK